MEIRNSVCRSLLPSGLQTYILQKLKQVGDAAQSMSCWVFTRGLTGRTDTLSRL